MIRKGLEVGLVVQDIREPGPLDGEAAVVGWLGLVPYSWGLKEGGESGGAVPRPQWTPCFLQQVWSPEWRG